MKKTVLAVFISVVLFSCDKNSIQQTHDSIKHADSLFTKANDGLQTLDSIAKTISDSNGITKKVIIPEIHKQQKIIDSTIKSGGYKIDSINKKIQKITKQVVVGTEVIKTLDSANDALNNGESAFKVLTRTADKILKQSKKANPAINSSSINSEKSPQQKTLIVDPLLKTATIEVEVKNLPSAKSLLRQKIRENSADLVTENFSQKEGFQREYITLKVPVQNFDRLVENLSSQLGNLRLKEITSEGTDDVAGQMADVTITLILNENLAANPFIKDDLGKNSDSFKEKSSNAFMDGFKVLGTAIVAILPFWPLFLIAGLVWFFVRRNRKAIAEKDFKTSSEREINEEKTSEKQAVINENPVEKPTDYSKYLPKN